MRTFEEITFDNLNTLSQEEIYFLFSKKRQYEILKEELSQHSWWHDIVQLAVDKATNDENYNYSTEYDFLEKVLLCTVGVELPLVSLAAKHCYLLNSYYETRTECIQNTALLFLWLNSSIYKIAFYKQLFITSNIKIEGVIKDKLDNLITMPPMVVKPKEVYDPISIYDEEEDNLILQGKNLNSNISYDVINYLNATAVNITRPDNYFPKPEKDSQYVYELIKHQSKLVHEIVRDRDCYFAHKYDKRGRIYSIGYHTDYQGNSYNKSSFEFAKKEIIEL